MRLSGRVLGKLAVDRRGVAAVEFAFIAPILILLYLGVVELTQGVMTEERAAHAASTIGDLVSQSSSVTASEVDDIFSVGDTIMYPYPTASLKMRVSSLTDDASGKVTVAWSRGDGLTKRAVGSTVSGLPANVISAGESVIMAETQYTYVSVFGQVMPKPVVFKETYYLRPRLSSSVACPDC